MIILHILLLLYCRMMNDSPPESCWDAALREDVLLGGFVHQAYFARLGTNLIMQNVLCIRHTEHSPTAQDILHDKIRA